MTIGTIKCVGKRDKKRREARMKLLKRCEGADLLVGKEDFSSWTNKPAREWVCARVKEVKEGKHIDLMCYCDTHNLDHPKYGKGCHTPRLILISYDFGNSGLRNS